jgi:hypothetical protein
MVIVTFGVNLLLEFRNRLFLRATKWHTNVRLVILWKKYYPDSQLPDSQLRNKRTLFRLSFQDFKKAFRPC